MPTWLTAKQAMEHLQVSKNTFYRLLREGHIKGYTFPGMTEARYSKEELDAQFTPMPKEDAGEKE